MGKERGFVGCIDRLFTWVACMAKSFDQSFATWVRGWVFVWFNGEEPSPDETLSTWIGRCAVAGHKPGLFFERIIDFFLGAGHCRGAKGRDCDNKWETEENESG